MPCHNSKQKTKMIAVCVFMCVNQKKSKTQQAIEAQASAGNTQTHTHAHTRTHRHTHTHRHTDTHTHKARQKIVQAQPVSRNQCTEKKVGLGTDDKSKKKQNNRGTRTPEQTCQLEVTRMGALRFDGFSIKLAHNGSTV